MSRLLEQLLLPLSLGASVGIVAGVVTRDVAMGATGSAVFVSIYWLAHAKARSENFHIIFWQHVGRALTLVTGYVASVPVVIFGFFWVVGLLATAGRSAAGSADVVGLFGVLGTYGTLLVGVPLGGAYLLWSILSVPVPPTVDARPRWYYRCFAVVVATVLIAVYVADRRFTNQRVATACSKYNTRVISTLSAVSSVFIAEKASWLTAFGRRIPVLLDHFGVSAIELEVNGVSRKEERRRIFSTSLAAEGRENSCEFVGEHAGTFRGGTRENVCIAYHEIPEVHAAVELREVNEQFSLPRQPMLLWGLVGADEVSCHGSHLDVIARDNNSALGEGVQMTCQTPGPFGWMGLFAHSFTCPGSLLINYAEGASLLESTAGANFVRKVLSKPEL